MAIEPLAIAIPQSTGLVLSQFKPVEEWIALYADDILLFLADPYDSLQKALEMVQEFGSHSGLQVNWDKSQIMLHDAIPMSERPVTVP